MIIETVFVKAMDTAKNNSGKFMVSDVFIKKLKKMRNNKTVKTKNGKI